MLSVTACQTTHLTSEEKKLIGSTNSKTPFRVLLTTDTQDSLILRKKSVDLDFENDREAILLLIERLKATLEEEQGVGIAAPQVGISRNLFLFIRIDRTEFEVAVAINPRIVNHPSETICFEMDGCLSVPDQNGNTTRYPWVEVEYTNEHGELIRERLEGYSRADNFVGIIFQHEYDHLQGILYIDRLCDQ